VCSTVLSSAKPRADDAVFDDIVIECSTAESKSGRDDAAIAIKLSRDEALQLCADISLQLKTLPILKPKFKNGPASVSGK
jgi:hypothetical protein